MKFTAPLTPRRKHLVNSLLRNLTPLRAPSRSPSRMPAFFTPLSRSKSGGSFQNSDSRSSGRSNVQNPSGGGVVPPLPIPTMLSTIGVESIPVCSIEGSGQRALVMRTSAWESLETSTHRESTVTTNQRWISIDGGVLHEYESEVRIISGNNI